MPNWPALMLIAALLIHTFIFKQVLLAYQILPLTHILLIFFPVTWPYFLNFFK